VDDLWATKSEGVGLSVRAISFQDLVLIRQRHRRTDGRTDRQTTCDRKTALCTIVHRAVKLVDVESPKTTTWRAAWRRCHRSYRESTARQSRGSCWGSPSPRHRPHVSAAPVDRSASLSSKTFVHDPLPHARRICRPPHRRGQAPAPAYRTDGRARVPNDQYRYLTRLHSAYKARRSTKNQTRERPTEHDDVDEVVKIDPGVDQDAADNRGSATLWAAQSAMEPACG